MRFIWNKGPADTQVTAFAVQATDGDNVFHALVPEGFHIPDNGSLTHFARSYAEWTNDKSDRDVILSQFNCGVQTGDELAFEMPVVEGENLRKYKRTAEEREEQEGTR